MKTCIGCVHGRELPAVSALRAALLLVALLMAALLVAAPPLQAQQVEGKPQVAQSARRVFDIPPQPLSSALPLFGQQSGRQVTADSELIGGVATPGVRGTMGVEEALGQLLAGTGLSWASGTGGTIVLHKPPRAGQLDPGVLQLDPVQVQGYAVPPQAMIGNLMTPFAGGEVARGGRVGVLGNRDYMDTPFSTTSYTDKYIRDNQARTMIDVVSDDPTIRPGYAPSQYDDRLMIRGFPLYTADMAFNGLYGVLSPFPMPLAGIERVEVFRGPTAMLSGMAPNGAVGGTINLVPKRAPDAGIAEFTTTYSTNAQFGGAIDVGRRFGPDKVVGLRVNAAYSGGDTPVAYQSDSLLNVTAGLDFRGERTRLDADVGYINRRIVGAQAGTFLAAGLLLPAAPNAAANYYQPWEFTAFNSTYGMLRFEHDLTDAFTTFLKVGGSSSNGAFIVGFPTITDTSGTTTATPGKFVSSFQSLGTELGVRARFETGALHHEAAVSGSYFNNWTGSGSLFTSAVGSNIYAPAVQPSPDIAGAPTSPSLTSQTVLTSVGFIDAVSALQGKLQLIGGFRWQQIQVGNWSSTTGLPTPGSAEAVVTPSVSLIVRPWKQLTFYGNFTQALEPGSIADPGLANAGTALPPFVSTQFEAGAKLDLGNFGATLALFQITKPNAFVDATTNSLVLNGEQRNSGLEFTLFGEPFKGVKPLGGFLWMSPVLTSTAGGTDNGHYAPGVPTFQANLGLDWETPYVKGLTVGGRVIYTGRAFIDSANLQPVPAWTRVDLSAKYVFERSDGRPLALRAQVINVGNDNYWMANSGYVTLGQPRTFMLSLAANF